MRDPLRERRNMADRTAERWRPPLFTPMLSRRQKWGAAIRRYFDVQAGSIWNDLAGELAKAHGRVLDVGCGAQPYRVLLPPDVTYIGIDTADAKAHFGYEMPDTLYFVGETWPIEDGAVEVVLCTETLEHVLEPRGLLAEAHRCLCPGGSLLLTVPFAARWHFIPHDYWRYTPSSLKHLLVEAGFDKIAVYARGNHLTVACYKTMALLLPLLFPQSSPPPPLKGEELLGDSPGGAHSLRPALAWASRLLGLLTLPFLLLLAVIANLSLKTEGGDDCLGYTVLAERPRPSSGSPA